MTKVGEFEAQGRKFGQEFAHKHGVGRRELHRFGKQHSLRLHRTGIELGEIALVAHTEVGTVLVDDHESRLDCRHYILAFILIVSRRSVFTQFDARDNLVLVGFRCGLHAEQVGLLFRSTVVLNSAVELFPSVKRLCLGRRTLSERIVGGVVGRQRRCHVGVGGERRDVGFALGVEVN